MEKENMASLWMLVFLSYVVEYGLCAKCGQTTYTSDSDKIYAPSWPSKYNGGLSCTYDITVSSYRRIILKWEQFDVDGLMPYCSGASDDSVTIYLGCSRKYLSSFCSRNAAMPHTIYTLDNCLRIVFKSSTTSNRGKGFVASYTSEPRDEPIYRTSGCQGGTSNSKSGVIYSPMWPESYPHRQSECEWKLKTSSDSVYKINVMALNIYKSGYCSSSYSDQLVIKGKKSKFTSYENKKYYCGSLNPFTMTTRYYEMEIDFEQGTRQTKSNPGFILGYVTYKADETATTGKFSIGSIIGGIIAFGVVALCIFLACRIGRNRCSNGGSGGRTIVTNTPRQVVTTTTTSSNYNSVPQGPTNYPTGAAPYPDAKYPPPGGYGAMPQYPQQTPLQAPYQGAAYPPPPVYSDNVPPPAYQAPTNAPPPNPTMPYPPQMAQPQGPSAPPAF